MAHRTSNLWMGWSQNHQLASFLQVVEDFHIPNGQIFSAKFPPCFASEQNEFTEMNFQYRLPTLEPMATTLLSISRMWQPASENSVHLPALEIAATLIRLYASSGSYQKYIMKVASICLVIFYPWFHNDISSSNSLQRVTISQSDFHRLLQGLKLYKHVSTVTCGLSLLNQQSTWQNDHCRLIVQRDL